MSSCLFCRIRDGEIPSTKVYEDEKCFAFRDLNPQAPTHVLICPKDHIATLNDVTDANSAIVGHLFIAAAQIAKAEGHADEGWRTVFNVNRAAGQTVFHIHLHVLGGRPLAWPPG